MANTYFLGFAAVAAIAVAGVDYMVQAQAAGAAPGTYPVSAYVDTFAGRFNTMRADRSLAARQAVRAKTHLPEASEGWERREWQPDLADPLQVRMALPDGAELADAQDTSFLAVQLRKQAASAAAKTAKEQVWEYVRGDEVIRLSALYTPPGEDGTDRDIVEDITDMAQFLENAQGYAVVQGVPFFMSPDAQQATEQAEEGAILPIGLKARIGSDIRLGVNARASADSVRTLLERIDYDALNAMLDAPQPGIGSAAPVLTPEEEAAALAALAAARTISEASATSAPGREQAAQGNALSRVKSFFGAGKSAHAGQAEPEDKPKRVQMSGGASCLEGSAGRFCRD